MRSILCASMLSAGIGLVSTAVAGVVVTRGDVDAYTQAVSGRLGSTSGSIVNDPPLIGGTSGIVELHPDVVAGPVLPGEIPSVPGTTGVVTAGADSVLEFIPTGSERVIDMLTACESSMVAMDGGTYQASAGANIELRFSVDAPTPFRLTGQLTFDDQSATSFVLFSGGTLGNILFRAGPGGNGAVDVQGVMGAGDYRLSMTTDIYEVPLGGGSTFAEAGMGQLHLVLNPNSNFAVGDMNCDGALSVGDIAPFVQALTTPAAYPVNYPACDVDLADINHDGAISVGDIGSFVELLTGG